MLRIPVRSGVLHQTPWRRMKSSSSWIRNTFIEYFVKEHGHKHVKSSSVIPLCDPTVPFVNAGMNQFKGVFLGNVSPPCPRAVNSQKCIRVGGKHNDLEVVGTDGTHHTFFEMLGNWSFGDCHKKEACEMAWDLLLGPYHLKPDNLLVTYFAGDAVIGLQEDRECRDVWKNIGVAQNRLKALGSTDNFWEMGATGPCGPCTEIHYIHPDGSLTEIWNIVFIQCNRDENGKVSPLPQRHVDTGLGLERLAALLQGKHSNYDTDLFQPIIKTIEKNSKGVDPYSGSYSSELDCAYRRLADHARMISVCLADSVFPAANLNLKQIIRKTLKMSSEVFNNPNLLPILYREVTNILGETYPELLAKEKDARIIIEHEQESYAKLRAQMGKKWRGLIAAHPEVAALADVELAGFADGYKMFKQAMAKQTSKVIPGEVVFKLYDTHGFPDDVIQRVATLNHMTIDNESFHKLLSQHKAKHKTALKEQTSNRGMLFNKAIETLITNGVTSTDDQHKYSYQDIDGEIVFEPLKTKLVAILNEDGEWIDVTEPSDNQPYYLVTEDTNFYCEEGGQVADSGIIKIKEGVVLKVDSVFKIKNFVFHKGYFSLRNSVDCYVRCGDEVSLCVDKEKRVKLMQNHTAVHLLNAAMRQVLPRSVVGQTGSAVTEDGLSLSLCVYGEKLSEEKILEAQRLIRESIASNVEVCTRVIDSLQLDPSVLAVPGETYPDTGLRLVEISGPLPSKELCCGTHATRTGRLRDCVVTRVRGAAQRTPTIHAVTGERALEARELFCRAEKLQQVIHLVEPSRCKDEVDGIKRGLAETCGEGGAPSGELARCLRLLDSLHSQTSSHDLALLQSVADTEVMEAVRAAAAERRPFVVHFLRCSYLMQEEGVARALAACRAPAPALVLGCAGGVIVAACRVPLQFVRGPFSAESWLSCVLPVFEARMVQTCGRSPLVYAEMTPTKVSLINCEMLVADAMRAAVQFARKHLQDAEAEGEAPSQDMRHN